MKGRKFEFLEHKADVYVAAYGKTLEEAFENAALATFEVMTETEKVTPKFEEVVEVEGFDEKALLYSWLEALLVKFDLTENLYSEFKIETIERRVDTHAEAVLFLKAKIQGEKFDPEKHPQKVGVKAVTYHRMEILKETNRTTVKFILDV